MISTHAAERRSERGCPSSFSSPSVFAGPSPGPSSAFLSSLLWGERDRAFLDLWKDGRDASGLSAGWKEARNEDAQCDAGSHPLIPQREQDESFRRSARHHCASSLLAGSQRKAACLGASLSSTPLLKVEAVCVLRGASNSRRSRPAASQSFLFPLGPVDNHLLLPLSFSLLSLFLSLSLASVLNVRSSLAAGR